MKKTGLWMLVAWASLLLLSPSATAAKQSRPPRRGGDTKPQEQRQARNNTLLTGTAVKTVSGTSPSAPLPELSLHSPKNDETALRLQNGANLSINHLTIQKRGAASSEEDSNFFSLNAAVAIWKNSHLTINGGRVETNGDGANAFVAYGENATLKVANLEIVTTQNSSRGLHATYGGKIEGENLKITTQGAHCAALATDRGSGTVKGHHIQAITNGDGSPGIYSTGNISATDSTFEAFDAEAAVIEGKNTITVRNCTMIGHRRCGAMLYQSFSGDAQTGTSIFTMNGGSLTAQTGPVFYVTNTNAKATVSNAKLTPGNGVLIEAGSNRWGRSGKNGGHLQFYAEAEHLNGDIVVNDISDVSLFLKQGTQLKGAINTKATAGKVNLELGKGTLWNVTADSSVDRLSSTEQTLNALRSQIRSNGHTIHYRTKHGFLNGETFPLDNGGMLIYTPAPKASIQPSNDEEHNNGRREREGHRPPPPDGFGRGQRRGAPPPPNEEF